jgi:hypothetical protein
MATAGTAINNESNTPAEIENFAVLLRGSRRCNANSSTPR